MVVLGCFLKSHRAVEHVRNREREEALRLGGFPERSCLLRPS